MLKERHRYNIVNFTDKTAAGYWLNDVKEDPRYPSKEGDILMVIGRKKGKTTLDQDALDR
jgi:hypothetical protein